MWVWIIAIIVTVSGIGIARYLFGVSNAMGDGGMALAVLGYAFVILGAFGSATLVYKTATFGLS